MTDPDSVCVVTHPLGAAGENATRTLLDILAAVTTVSLVTADLPIDSSIRDQHEVLEVSQAGAGDSILVAAFRFVLNQVRMARVVGRREESTILFFGATAYLLPILAAKLAGKTVVLEPRGDVPLTLRLTWEQRIPVPLARLLAGSLWAIERLNYHLSDAIITYTPSMAAELALDDFEEKLYPNGARYVDTDAFRPTVPFEDRETIVGFVGRLDEEKNVRLLAQAASKLPDDVTFRFVGDGPLREELQREFADAVAAGHIELTGWIDHDDVPAELNQMRLLVMPSEPTEGLPTTILESMACGTPAYSTPVSGVPDVVRDGETGFHMTESSTDGIASRINEILGSEDLSTISASARDLIAESYSFDAAVQRYEDILRSIS